MQLLKINIVLKKIYLVKVSWYSDGFFFFLRIQNWIRRNLQVYAFMSISAYIEIICILNSEGTWLAVYAILTKIQNYYKCDTLNISKCNHNKGNERFLVRTSGSLIFSPSLLNIFTVWTPEKCIVYEAEDD